MVLMRGSNSVGRGGCWDSKLKALRMSQWRNYCENLNCKSGTWPAKLGNSPGMSIHLQPIQVQPPIRHPLRRWRAADRKKIPFDLRLSRCNPHVKRLWRNSFSSSTAVFQFVLLSLVSSFKQSALFAAQLDWTIISTFFTPFLSTNQRKLSEPAWHTQCQMRIQSLQCSCDGSTYYLTSLLSSDQVSCRLSIYLRSEFKVASIFCSCIR